MRTLKSMLLFALTLSFLQGCGGCGDVAPGEICDPAEEAPCAGHELDLVCMQDEDGEHRCLHPAGGLCDVDDDPDFCGPGAVCRDELEGVHRCYLTEGAACEMGEEYCVSGAVCAEMADGGYECHKQLLVAGMVFDALSGEPIAGAHVIAFDELGSALSDVGITDPEGLYSVDIPAVREADGAPAQQFFTLRADSQDYQAFPGTLRTAQPIDASNVDLGEEHWEIDTAQTDIALLPLPDYEQGYARIQGTVDVEGGLGGVLVVAETYPDTGFSGVSARDGAFTIFDVPPGEYVIGGYLAGYQIEPVELSVSAEDVGGVILRLSEEGIMDVTGQIQIVSAHGSLRTSVILVVASTFDAVSVRGETPAGLRAPRSGTPDISGSWTIEGVPAGEYYVLAGFENDHLVRDPNEGTAGTDLVRTTVPAEGGTMTVTPAFKVTEALETVSPGAHGPEALTEPPTLVWGQYSNAQWYDAVVFDAFGEVVWELTDIPPPGGQADVEVEYDGPFEEGMYYQFRAIAHRSDSPISSTEPLRGVFYRW